MFHQKFGFLSWSDFDEHLWQELLDEAKNSQKLDLNEIISGSDHDYDVLTQARANAERCGIGHKITFTQTDLSQLEAPTDCGILISLYFDANNYFFEVAHKLTIKKPMSINISNPTPTLPEFAGREFDDS